MTRVLLGSYIDKEQRGNVDGDLQNDDETVSIQLRRPAGYLANKEQVPMKKGSVPDKHEKSNSDITFKLAWHRLVLIAELLRFP